MTEDDDTWFSHAPTRHYISYMCVVLGESLETEHELVRTLYAIESLPEVAS